MKKINISFILLLFIFSACKKEKVGGECDYKEVTKTVSVTFIDGELDADFTVSFQPIGIDTDEIYRLTHKELKDIKKKFSNNQLQNKENNYVLTIAEITKGTCVPFVIKEITLKKKD